MPIEVHWDNEAHTVIRADVSGIWTMDEAHECRRQMFEMFDSVYHRVDIILHWADNESRTHLPPGIMNILVAMARTPHARRGMIVFVPKRLDMLSRIWSDVISKALPRLRRQSRGAETLEEAREILKTENIF